MSNQSIQEVLFFPQMRPEKKPLELNDNEKAIYDLLKQHDTMVLEDLKAASQLSNKAWDKGIKGLTKLNVAKVEKTDGSLIVSLKAH